MDYKGIVTVNLMYTICNSTLFIFQPQFLSNLFLGQPNVAKTVFLQNDCVERIIVEPSIMEDPLITNDEEFADILAKFATWNEGE